MPPAGTAATDGGDVELVVEGQQGAPAQAAGAVPLLVRSASALRDGLPSQVNGLLVSFEVRKAAHSPSPRPLSTAGLRATHHQPHCDPPSSLIRSAWVRV
jgi:hypothetical protein